MKVVTQCTYYQSTSASTLRDKDGKDVQFIAHPEEAPNNAQHYARPDDLSDDSGKTWRQKLVEYNQRFNETGANPDNLLPAYRLYTHRAFAHLVHEFGAGNVYIFSIAWGLVSAKFLTPAYDIIHMSNKKLTYTVLSKGEEFENCCLLPDDGENTIFLGERKYELLFHKLTTGHKGKKILFYISPEPPNTPDVELRKYPVGDLNIVKEWHHKCAEELTVEGIRSGVGVILPPALKKPPKPSAGWVAKMCNCWRELIRRLVTSK